MFTRQNNNVLFIEGITSLDKISKTMNNSTIISDDIIIDELYDSFRHKFTGINNWDFTNICCYNCSLSFKEKPVFIPKKINSETNIEVLGNFCSFSCAIRYINTYYSNDDSVRCNYINSLKYLYSRFHDGKRISYIPEALPKEVMKKYGGDLTEKEYREEIKKLNNAIK